MNEVLGDRVCSPKRPVSWPAFPKSHIQDRSRRRTMPRKLPPKLKPKPAIIGGGTGGTHKDYQVNDPKEFPDLKLCELERYAEMWVKEFSSSPIARIIMYRPKLNALGRRIRAENENDRRPSIQYIMIFECFCALHASDPLSRTLQKFSAGRIPPLYPDLLDRGFICVYKQEPAYEFSLEWYLIDTVLGGPPCKYVNMEAANWVLYPRHKPDAVKESGKSLMRSAGRFQVPTGTKWGDITITIDDFAWAKITTPIYEERVHFAELGMKDGRKSGSANNRWKLLFDFAANQAVGPNSGQHYKDLPKLVSDLGRDLKNIFGIQENPFTRYNKRKGGYTPNFKLVFDIDREALENRLKDGSKSIFESEVEEKSAWVTSQTMRTNRPNMD
jgi:hypothetical protein